MARSPARKSTALQPASRSRSSVPAPHARDRVSLNASEKVLLDEALEQCRQAADEVQDRFTMLGVWLLRHLFANDARAALGEGADGGEKSAAGGEVGSGAGGGPRGERVWSELVRRAGGPSLRLTPKMLSVALRAAAWDKLIPDENWRSLDVGRKELLLPLGESDLLREGAQHVVSMRLTQRATRSYVQNTLEAYRDKAPESRLTPRLVATSLRKARLRITEAAVRRRIRQFAGKYDAAERKVLVAEIDALLGALREVKRELATGK